MKQFPNSNAQHSTLTKETTMRIAIMLTLILTALSFGEGQSKKLNPLPKELQGDIIPSFSVLAPDNETRFGRKAMGEEVKKLGVKRVVLSFFATWCENCRAEFLLMKEHAAKLKEKGVQVYLIDVNEDIAKKGKEGSDKDVKDFVEKYAGGSFPYYFDQNVGLLKSFGIVAKNASTFSLPVIVVMDTELRVLSVFTEAGNDFPQILWEDL